jgi:hypothetical protein
MAWEAPQIAVIAAGCAYRAVAPELVRWEVLRSFSAANALSLGIPRK